MTAPMTPGRYLRLRRETAELGIDELPIDGLSVIAIECDARPPTDMELWALGCAFRFDTTVLVSIARGVLPQVCRVCGCSELDACLEQVSVRSTAPCAWAEPDLCTACVVKAPPSPQELAA